MLKINIRSCYGIRLWGWLAVFVLSLMLYISTLAPDVVWQDQGDYQYQAAKCTMNIPGDVVRVHPLFTVTSHVVGRLGIFSYAYSANLVSAVFAAVAVANVFLLTFILSGRKGPALLAASVFAMSHSAWFLGVQAQTYSMANAAMSGGLVLLLAYIRSEKRVYLYWMGIVFGLGISAHMMSQIAFFIIAVWLFYKCLVGKEQWTSLAIMSLLWFVGAILLWVAVYIEYDRTGKFGEALLSAVYGRWGQEVFNLGRLILLIKRSILFFVLNFPTVLVLLAPAGIVYSIKKSSQGAFEKILLACTILYLIFAVRYDVPNQNNFFLPMYMLVSVYIGLGFGYLFKKNIRLSTIVVLLLAALIPFTYIAISRYASVKKVDLGLRRHIQYRDGYRYYLLPWQQGQTGPRRLATEVDETLPPGSVILPDSTPFSVFQYIQEIEGKLQGVVLLGMEEKQKAIDLLKSGRRCFTFSDVKSYYPSWVEDSSWLKPFAISESEQIYEIVLPESY